MIGEVGIRRGSCLAALVLACAAFGGTERPWVVINEDLDGSVMTLAEGDLNREGLRRYYDEHIHGPCLTHYFVNPQAMTAGYDTKVSEPSWTEHPGLKPAYPHVKRIKRLHDVGIDPYAVLMERAKERGVSPWISMRMNDVHGVGDPMNGCTTRMWLDHPEWRRLPGCEGDGPLGGWSNGAYDYTHREVYDFHLAYAREMMERYTDAEGIECDWMRFPHHLPKYHERDHADVLTAFMRDVRRMADEIGKKRGRRYLVGVRVASTVENAISLGTDVELWAKEGSVDVVTPANFFTTADFESGWSDWRRILKKANPAVRLLAGTDDGIAFDGYDRRRMTVAEFCGFFDLALAAGVTDGVSLFNYYASSAADPTYALVVHQGLTRERLAVRERSYPVTFHDACGDDMPPQDKFPQSLDRRITLGITAGTPNADDRVVVSLLGPKGQDGTVFPLGGALLNGNRPLRILSADSCEFDPAAVRPGVNAFSCGPGPGLSVHGCTMTFKPRKSNNERSQ